MEQSKTPDASGGGGVSLADLHAANVARQAEWCAGGDPEPDLAFRGNELAGETGEACNVIKKLERERHGWRGSRATKEQLAEKLADVVICADLCAVTAGIDLDAAVRDKFNATSEKVGLTTKLAALASAPPAPTPEAGSDLVRRGDVLSICKESADTSVNYIFSGAEPDHNQRREAMEATATSIRHAVANLPAAAPSPSPPPGEDLAGQGETVAWEYERAVSVTSDDTWLNWESQVSISHPEADAPWIRNIRPLYAAPAPSRPADREEIERVIRDTDYNTAPPDGLTPQAWLAQRIFLALRDAPRDGGDGWRPIETAPKDGTLFWALQIDRDTNEQQFVCWWLDDFANWTGWRDNWDTEPEPTHWRPLPAPPSPNAGDGTQDRQGGDHA